MKKKDLKDIFMAGVDRVLGYNAVNDYLNKNPIPLAILSATVRERPIIFSKS